MKIHIFIIATILLLGSGFADTVSAHKVVVFAWVENGQIYVEGGFGSKRKALNSPIEVIDAQGEVIHKGKTNENGAYQFSVPQNAASDLTIWLEAGKGHKGKWVIKKEELFPEAVEDAAAIAKEKEERLEKGPPVWKIAAGIAVIFFIALVVQNIRKAGKTK